MPTRCPVCAGMPSGMGIYPQHTYDSSCKATSPTEILLAPHADDESLFAAYACLRYRPLIVCCTTPKESMRVSEFAAACDVFRCERVMWDIPEGTLTDEAVAGILDSYDPDLKVYAPAYEEDGHEEHIAVSAGVRYRGFAEIVGYLTYRRGFGRSRGTPVPYEPHWPGLKLRAMACYQSQINLPATQPWFTDDWLNEWTA